MSGEMSILPVQTFYSLDDGVVEGTVLHREPLIMRFERLLTDDECRQLIESAAPRLTESRRRAAHPHEQPDQHADRLPERCGRRGRDGLSPAGDRGETGARVRGLLRIFLPRPDPQRPDLAQQRSRRPRREMGRHAMDAPAARPRACICIRMIKWIRMPVSTLRFFGRP